MERDKGKSAPKMRKARAVHAVLLSDQLLILTKKDKGDGYTVLLDVCGAVELGYYPDFLSTLSLTRKESWP